MSFRDHSGGAAPTPAQILLACLRSPDRTLLDLCAHPNIDWASVSDEAWLHRVGPLMFDALQRGGVVAAGYVPAPILTELRGQRRRLASMALKLDAALAVALDALAAAGVPAMVLKGPALARLYPNPSLRPRSDLDLLVDAAHWPAADRLLADLGYGLLDAEHVQRPLLSYAQAPEDRQYKHAQDNTMIELHADYLSTGLRRADDAAVWERVEIVEVNGLRLPVLAPRDAFLQVTTHMERHGFTRLLWFYDLFLLLRAEGERIPWAQVARQAERAGVAVAAYFGISYTEALFGPVVSPAARAALRPNALRRRLYEGMWPRRRILALDPELIRALDALVVPQLLRDAQQQRDLDRMVPLPPTVFDVYDPPRRMLAHLLTYGNVGPKLGWLGRRLVPTEEWLRHHGPQEVGHYRTRLLLARVLDRLG